MLESQIESEATRDTIVRRLIPGFVLRDVEFFLNESTAVPADSSSGLTWESETQISLLRFGLVTLTGKLKRTRQKTISCRWFQRGQIDPQTRTIMPTQAHSDRVEERLQNEIKPVIRRASAREQQLLLNTTFA